MKPIQRLAVLFTALALLLTLASCAKKENTDAPGQEDKPTEETPDVPTLPEKPAVPDPEELSFSELRVELVVGERDVDNLLQLKSELPSLLISALSEQDCTVGAVTVTFGASAEATAQALERGSVDVAFLPTEAFAAHTATLRAVCEQEGAGEKLAVVALTDALKTRDFGKEPLTAAEQSALRWLLPEADDDAKRLAGLWLGTQGLWPDDLTYDEYAAAYAVSADTCDLAVLTLPQSDDAYAILAECPRTGECVAVNASADPTGSDRFAAALTGALQTLSTHSMGGDVLAYYAAPGAPVRYLPVREDAFDWLALLSAK